MNHQTLSLNMCLFFSRHRQTLAGSAGVSQIQHRVCQFEHPEMSPSVFLPVRIHSASVKLPLRSPPCRCVENVFPVRDTHFKPGKHHKHRNRPARPRQRGQLTAVRPACGLRWHRHDAPLLPGYRPYKPAALRSPPGGAIYGEALTGTPNRGAGCFWPPRGLPKLREARARVCY